MPRLNVEVEGQTEQAFVLRVLQPHLTHIGVTPRRALTSRKTGQRGGLFRYQVVKNDIQGWLKRDRAPDVFFSTMFDLYGLPKDFPSFGEAAKENDPYSRVARLEEALAEDIGDTRFIPYIQLHEFESLLLAKPEAFGCRFAHHDKQIEALIALCAKYKSPELIDDGQQTAPSKRIGNEIPEYLAAKATAGPIIAMEIGLETIRAKCPHFHQWLTKLEGLATLSAHNS